MPGYSEECTSGAHQVCANRDCRCGCHSWVQELASRPTPRSDPTGGVRRTGEVIQLEAPRVFNTCPQCGSKQLPTDTFCRRDGTRLSLGKQCLGCGAPGNPEDIHCWQCGLKHGEKPPETPVEEIPKEDRLVELKKKAVELGLLKETVV